MGTPKWGDVASTAELHRRKQKRIDAQKVSVIGGEVVAYTFTAERWFKDLVEAIYKEIERLKVCKIRDLTQGKFADVDHYYLITALDLLGDRIDQKWRGTFTEYSARPVHLKKAKSLSWKERAEMERKSACRVGLAQNRERVILPDNESLYGRKR